MTLRLLFAGYAPVHFVCFLPLYRRLSALPGIDIRVSGGLRTTTENGHRYDEQAMYRPFDLPADRVLAVDDLREREFDVLFAAHTHLIRPKRVQRTIQIFHGISYRNRAVRPENMSCDHYFIVGPYMRRRFADAGLLGESDPRAVPIGFMKTDPLLNGTLDRARVLQRLGFSGERPVVLYAPTGARHNSLETMGEQVIARINRAGRYDLAVKLHDHPKNQDTDWHARLAPFEGPHCRIADEPDVVPLLHAADLLLSDASSVSNEFTLLDRPIVYLDVPELIAEASARDRSMLDLDTWGRRAGLVVKQADDVEGAIAFSLQHPYTNSEVRRAMAGDFFYNPGRATDTAMAWLEANLLADSLPRREAALSCAQAS
jgi:hypothetical protein